jgi:hypothetical protein
MNLIILLLITSTLCACSSETKDETKAHPAAYLTDVFAIDNGMPLRETQKKDFYFKKCELESRRPFQSKIEYSCNEP